MFLPFYFISNKLGFIFLYPWSGECAKPGPAADALTKFRMMLFLASRRIGHNVRTTQDKDTDTFEGRAAGTSCTVYVQCTLYTVVCVCTEFRRKLNSIPSNVQSLPQYNLRQVASTMLALQNFHHCNKNVQRKLATHIHFSKSDPESIGRVAGNVCASALFSGSCPDTQSRPTSPDQWKCQEKDQVQHLLASQKCISS